MRPTASTAVAEQDVELESAAWHDKGDVASPRAISRLRFCLRSRCLRLSCVLFPCVLCLLVYWSLPASADARLKRVCLFLALAPPACYVFLGVVLLLLVYCHQVGVDVANARAAHSYLHAQQQLNKVAVTSGQPRDGVQAPGGGFPGRFALFLQAARSGDVATAKLCLANGQDVDEGDHLGRAALHWAALSGSDEVLALLLRSGASVDQRDALEALTAVHYAAYYGHVKSTRLLVAAGANLTLVDQRKLNPLQLTEMASLKLQSVQPTHQMIIRYLRGVMHESATPPLEHVAGLTVTNLVDRQTRGLPQMH